MLNVICFSLKSQTRMLLIRKEKPRKCKNNKEEKTQHAINPEAHRLIMRYTERICERLNNKPKKKGKKIHIYLQ